MSSDWLEQLNLQQQTAVMHEKGPLLVLAGAGSGKTRTLTYRAAWLIQQNIPANQILLLTFTNKAAQEMLNRLLQLSGTDQPPFAGTFHRLGSRILRQHAHLVGLSHQYVIYDDEDQLNLVKQIIQQLGLNSQKFKPRSLLATISQAKNELLTPEQYSSLAADSWQRTTAQVYQHYQKMLQQHDACDFDDLINYPVMILKQHPQIRDQYQQQYLYLLIDEYQDTNQSQYQFSKLLTGPEKNLTVVGDFSQAIYSWRGADYRNLDHLKSDFPDLTVIKLEQNYRSTQTILNAAYQIISHNRNHPILKLWTDSDAGENIKFYAAYDEKDESRFVAERILSLLTQGYNYADIAVLYRTNAQSRVIEESLLHLGIPYQLVGGIRFYSRKEIKDLLAFLKLILNPLDILSQQRIVKIGKRRAQAFFDWQTATAQASQQPTLELIDQVLEATHYLEMFNPQDPSDQSRLENIQELRSVAAQFPRLDQFLENVMLVEQEAMQQETPSSKVTLMTLHAAKGLEFEVVFITGMEEGLFPHSRSLMDPWQLEEERRLCYVGITRAKHLLYLSCSQQRYHYGRRQHFTPSRFIKEISSDLLDQLSDHQAQWQDEAAEFMDLDFKGVFDNEL